MNVIGAILFCVGFGCLLIGADMSGQIIRSRTRTIFLDRFDTDGLRWMGMTILLIGLVATSSLVAYQPDLLSKLSVVETIEKEAR